MTEMTQAQPQQTSELEMEQERVVRIEGVLDANSAPQVRKLLDGAIAAGPLRIVLDFSGLRLIDSTGVGAIVNAFKQLRQQGRRLIVTGLRDQPLAMFRLLRLDRVLSDSPTS